MLRLYPLMAAILDEGQGHPKYNFKISYLKDHPSSICFKMAHWFLRACRKFFNISPIREYVKIMSADRGHLGWMSGSVNKILTNHLPRTIHLMFALNWFNCFYNQSQAYVYIQFYLSNAIILVSSQRNNRTIGSY